MGNRHFTELNYKQQFIYGVFVSIILLGCFGTIVDAYVGNIDAFIDFGYTLATYITFMLFFNKNKIEKSALALFWISAISEYGFLITNRVDFDLIFSLLIPIIAFVSMSLKRIIINLILFYIPLIGIMLYYYYKIPHHFFLHNFKYMFAFFLGHLFMLAYGVFYHLAIDESIKRLKEVNDKNALLLKEVHHRVKNNLNLMASILGLQARRQDNIDVKNALSDSQRRIQSMATLHEVLYKNDNNKHHNLKIYIDKLVSNIIACESCCERVEVTTDIDNIKLTLNSMIHFGIMLNEMVTNSIKHSSDKNNIKIDIIFKKNPDNYYFQYCDNSKDILIPKLRNGFGHNLIDLTVEQFNGKMEIDTKNGLCYKMHFSDLEEE